jgi:baculoviral IAP repeat-containing protein 2/3
MGLQGVRLKSSESWPLSFMDQEEMATAAFYYTCHGDRVRRPFFKSVTGHWKSGDVHFDKHKQLSPNCSFVARRVSTASAAP